MWKVSYPVPGEFIPVTATPAEFGREAADGQSLYFAHRHEADGLWQQPFAGGPARQLVPKLHRRNLFVPAAGGVYYIASSGQPSQPALFFWNAATGTSRQLRAFQEDIFWGLDVSPDERTLYYSQVDVANSDIMLVKEFR